MTARLDVFSNPAAQKFIRYIGSAAKALDNCGLPEATQELVKLRASQINGCSFCTDMHYKDAVHHGEDPLKLNMVAAWREATVFSEEERAALLLTEEGTRIADAQTGVSDEVWDTVKKHFDDDQLFALIGVIALINAYNRMNCIVQMPAGSYTPGMFG